MKRKPTEHLWHGRTCPKCQKSKVALGELRTFAGPVYAVLVCDDAKQCGYVELVDD